METASLLKKTTDRKAKQNGTEVTEDKLSSVPRATGDVSIELAYL